MCKSPLYAYIPRRLVDERSSPFYHHLVDGKWILDKAELGEVVPIYSEYHMHKRKKSPFYFVSFDEFTALQENEPLNEYFRIPCGQCMECRLSYSKEWASRIVAESLFHENNLFLTLTYNDDHIHLNDKGLSTLNYNDLQSFMKVLRERCFRDFGVRGLRFYACGEYGDSTARSHFHLCLFGVPQQIVDSLKYFGASFDGNPYFTSDYFDSCWNRGYIIIGDLTYQSAAYVARYVCKKLKGKESSKYKLLDITPEQSRMSLKPGIGKLFFDIYKEDIYKNDEMFLPNVGKVAVSRYFDNLYEFENPERLALIKANRVRRAVIQLNCKLRSTDMNEKELLNSELINLENRCKKLVRPIDF